GKRRTCSPSMRPTALPPAVHTLASCIITLPLLATTFASHAAEARTAEVRPPRWRLGLVTHPPPDKIREVRGAASRQRSVVDADPVEHPRRWPVPALRLATVSLPLVLLLVWSALARETDRFGEPLPPSAVARLESAHLRAPESSRLTGTGRVRSVAL